MKWHVKIKESMLFILESWIFDCMKRGKGKTDQSTLCHAVLLLKSELNETQCCRLPPPLGLQSMKVSRHAPITMGLKRRLSGGWASSSPKRLHKVGKLRPFSLLNFYHKHMKICWKENLQTGAIIDVMINMLRSNEVRKSMNDKSACKGADSVSEIIFNLIRSLFSWTKETGIMFNKIIQINDLIVKIWLQSIYDLIQMQLCSYLLAVLDLLNATSGK